MSKSLVLKALSLLQEENEDKVQRENVTSSSKRPQRTKKLKASKDRPRAPVDKTAKNLEVLKELRKLRPRSSTAQKVIGFYTAQNNLEDAAAKAEPQRSILFDDDDDKDLKRKKKRRRQKAEDDS